MSLSWNEIRQRAITFAREWADARHERAEAQSFWNDFFEVFGIRRRSVAAFEEPVRNLGGAYGFIDLFWRGKVIAEHKSRGESLERAHSQAANYIQDLQREGRGEEVPRFIIVSDFARIALHDLEADDPTDATLEFTLDQLPDCIRHFAFIAGYETCRVDPEDPANFKATELLANLHDRLEESGYTGHDLQRFMVRVLFCLFAEDTGIFEPEAFTSFIERRTREDGSDLGGQLSHYFSVLNTPNENRQRNLDEDLAPLPYVNGELFSEHLAFPAFTSAMRTALLACCRFRWEKINPAIFGSLFQNIMEAPARRQIGAHYTSERDILKLIRSLFLDELRERFEKARRNNRALDDLLRELGRMNFLDPACGCGNFLVIAYRELRLLEMDIIQARYGDNPSEGDIRASAQLNVSQFYGIEIEEWPVRIAEVAMWLMDHQMNNELFKRFGQPKATTPLTRSPHIRHGNALRIDWNEVLPAAQCTYILGNPPFVGARYQDASQRADMRAVVDTLPQAGALDYVTGWYFKAAEYSQANPQIRIAFVSTNSITQGEQVGVVWGELLRRGITIHFAHRTFAWMSEARGRAHVHVVIVGWGLADRAGKRIFDYETNANEPTVIEARVINPYLVDAPVVTIVNRSQPLCAVPSIGIGNKPIDGGNYLFTPEEKQAFIAREPRAAPYFRQWLGSVEFLNGIERWCLWLGECPPEVLRSMPLCMERVENVRRLRRESRSEPTRRIADTPTRFHVENIPSQRYLLIPEVSSERRQYIPMGFIDPCVLASNLVKIASQATLYHFGVLHSAMHMAWVRQVCGRLKSDYRYSAKLVYNNFPWPQDVTDRQRSRVEEAAQQVLDARAEHPGATLADLYDPNAMPVGLRRAHQALDRAVDACYRRNRFDTERQRLEYLFELYEQLTAPLTVAATPRRKKRRRTKRS